MPALLEIERDLPGQGVRAVTQTLQAEDVSGTLRRLLANGFVRSDPDAYEWSPLRDGDRAIVHAAGAITMHEYRGGAWRPCQAAPAVSVSGQARLF